MIAVSAALAGTPAAQAVTNGQPDDGRHPYVGALVTHKKDRKKRLICSGTLVSPTVFLTAAHCLVDEPENLYVSFDPFVGAPDVGPSVVLHRGTAAGHLAFTDSTAPGDTHDIGVVRLDHPVEGIAPASLPRPGLLDRLKQPGLEFVGYGREGFDGKRFYGGGGRRFAFGAFSALEPFKLINDQSGTLGGSCNGDSGGPVLLRGTNTVLAIISDGDPHCQVNGINYRADTASARDFLDDFMPVPPPSGNDAESTELEPAPQAVETEPAAPATAVQPGEGFEPEATASGAVVARFASTRRGARVRVLRLRNLAAGSKVAVICSSTRGQQRRCPFTVRGYARTGALSIASAFKRRVLPVGTTVTVRIAGVGRRVRVVTFTVRSGRVARSAR